MNRATIILVLAGIFLLTAALYAGEGALAFFSVLCMEGGIALLWIVAAGMLGAVVLRPLRLEVDWPLRVVTACALGLGIYSLAALGLGLAGWLNWWTAMALPVVSVGLFVGEILLRMGNVSLERKKGELEAWLSGRPTGWWPWMGVMVFLGIAAVGSSLPPWVLWKEAGDPHPYDVVEYHLQVPREWYQLGRIVPLRHNAYGYFPFNMEMQYLLGMHLRGGPWVGMYLAQYLAMGYGGLFILSVYAVGRELNKAASGPAIGALVAVSVPWVVMLSCVVYNEVGLLLYGTLAAGWIVVGMRKWQRGAFALAGVMAGLACGVKYTAVPIVLVAVPAAMVLVGGMNARRLLIGAASFVLCGVLAFAPWLARNWVWTGNPVFPEAMGVFGRGHFSEAQQVRWERAHSARADQAGAGEKFKAVWKEVAKDERYAYLLWPMGLITIIGVGRGRTAALLGLLLAGHVIFWMAFTHLQSRFFVLGIGVVALAVGMPMRSRWMGAAASAMAVLTALSGWVVTHRLISKELSRPRVLESIGQTDVMMPTEKSDLLKSGEKIALVGDAMAFLYPVDIRLLRYRTVFDVDAKPGQSLADAWLGDDAELVRREYHLIINRGELARMLSTYSHGLPSDLPPEGPIIIPPSARNDPSSR